MATIDDCMSMELMDTLMVSFGSHFDFLSSRYVQANGDLYTTALNVMTMSDAVKDKLQALPPLPSGRRCENNCLKRQVLMKLSVPQLQLQA